MESDQVYTIKLDREVMHKLGNDQRLFLGNVLGTPWLKWVASFTDRSLYSLRSFGLGEQKFITLSVGMFGKEKTAILQTQDRVLVYQKYSAMSYDVPTNARYSSQGDVKFGMFCYQNYNVLIRLYDVEDGRAFLGVQRIESK